MYRTLILFFTLSYGAFSSADVLQFSSGEHRVYLLELYSSQGCSSCPPAQEWVNQLQSTRALWNKVVPVVFHVDYWDYLGWKDPFSKPQFSFRQRAHLRQNNIKSVYTPGFVVNGKEWKGWFRGRKLNLKNDDAGSLTFSLSKPAGRSRQFNAQYSQRDQEASRNLQLTVALLGMDQDTKVRAGENRSKKLKESFIVLDLLMFQSFQPEDNNARIQVENTVFFSDSISINNNAEALAIWVSDQHSLHPIQSTGGYL